MAVNEDLTGFIREALDLGLPREEIRDVLRQADWSDDEVHAAFLSYAAVDFPIAVPRPRPSLSAREAFEYLVLFGTLYLCAGGLGSLLFQLIDLALPNPSWSQARIDAIPDIIRQSIATLVVATPVFVYMARANSQAIALSPLKRTSPVRGWLTYLTLAIAAAVLVGMSIDLVYNLLGADLTARYLLQALTVGGIAGCVFVYYLSDLRRAEKEEAG